MSAAPRRHHDFRRVTDVTLRRGVDGDSLYRMPSSKLDLLVQHIRIPNVSDGNNDNNNSIPDLTGE